MTPSPIRLDAASEVLRNLPVAELVEHAVKSGDRLAANGALVALTGKYTGRTPKDKHTVREPGSEENIWWENNNSMDPATFAKLVEKANAYLAGKHAYVIDTYGGADPRYRIAARFIVTRPYHALFIKQLLIRPSSAELATYEPEWTVVDLGDLSCDPATDGTKGDAVIALNFAEKTVLIMGTQYAGEMKKSVFTILNYLLPLQGVLSMHCSANIGAEGDTALFFGLSGTGKTTLSASPNRRLIGDDEHGWTDTGVFNFEGGCYAKCIKLSAAGEPEIWNAIRFGSVLENVVMDAAHVPDFDDGSITENTRCAYPIDYIENAVEPSVGGHPKNIVFLTCDAFGVLPPISRLTPEQAMFHFLNGYTAKVAGTEAGVTEPQTTFSTCFGAPFLPLRPKVYAELLRDKIARHGAKVWLVNTGWTGGPYGVGSRMKLAYTRAMIDAAFSGGLDGVEFVTDPVFGLSVPTTCPNVPSEVLLPRNTWSDKDAYDAKATQLAGMFEENFRKFA
ncbi:MAG TPA: phosphoenolpyruvate carboxykinase (ATP) [Fimbriimonadaceae bacterium]|nr:phosphoenolpyruvate carboxykinase (ATP) [Fimbriimonadaceae bacterium]HRJ95525.1 phosphoenolpyruvate carboxykinase (ATP) [Fimbriimonadaceae bacterium]